MLLEITYYYIYILLVCTINPHVKIKPYPSDKASLCPFVTCRVVPAVWVTCTLRGPRLAGQRKLDEVCPTPWILCGSCTTTYNCRIFLNSYLKGGWVGAACRFAPLK